MKSNTGHPLLTLKGINASLVFKGLLLSDFCLLGFYLITNAVIHIPGWNLGRWFDFDAEANIPTWFSSAQLLLVSLVAALYAQQIRDQPRRRFYLLLSAVFLFFSMDETASIHEGITKVSQKLALYSCFPHGHGMWIFVYSGLGFVLMVLFRQEIVAFWSHEPNKALLLSGGALFVLGGVGFEVLGYYLAALLGADSLPYLLEVSLEESLELLGPSLMIYALLTNLNKWAETQA